MTQQEIIKLQNYLRSKFGTERINVMPRPKNDDSVEVTLGGEFIGVIYKDDEDPNDVSYDFNMAILGMDLA
jgi:DNA-binding transcriptional regulator LsrR (DeoR family)